MTNSSCLAPEILAAYVDGSLPGPDAVAAERHIEGCPACLQRLEEAERKPGRDVQLLRQLRVENVAANRPEETARAGVAVSPPPRAGNPSDGQADPFEKTGRIASGEVDTSVTADRQPPEPRRPPATIADLDLDKQPAAFGRYQLEKKLGEGGMGAVFLATDTVLGRKVAIKIPFHSSTRERQDVLARFRREARCAAALDHPNICAVYDVGEIDGQPYMAMAYVSGKPLSDYIRAKEDIPVKVALQVARRLARTLEHAHSRGVLHRDLKPSNIMFSDRKEPVVMDFGLARLEADHRQEPLTRSGDIVGTPAYMPPEQLGARHSEMGPWSDVYSLGVILYQLLTKHRPFDGDLFELVHKIANEGASPPSRRRPEVDSRVDDLVLKCLQKSPRDRFSSMTQLAAAIDECLKAVPGTKSSSTSTSSATTPSLSASMPSPPTLLLDRVAGTDAASQPGSRVPPEYTEQQTRRRASSQEASRAASLPPETEVNSPGKTPSQPESSAMPSVTEPPAVNPFASFAETAEVSLRARRGGRKTTAARGNRRQGSGRGRTRGQVAVASAAFGVLLLLGVVLFFRTPKGTLRVELEDPTVEVHVQGENVTLTGADPKPVRLTVGEKSFVVKRGKFQFETKSLVLRKNETVTARVETVEGEMRVVADGREIGRATLPGKSAPLANSSVRPAIPTPPGSAPPQAERWAPTPEFKQWMDAVAKMPPDEQVKAVSAKMKDLNPGFNGELRPRFDADGKVFGLNFSKNVNLTNDAVVDISPLAALSDLKDLGIEGDVRGGSRISNLSPLNGLRLTHFNCGFTQVSDLSPLSGMPLELLNLWGTRVPDLEPLTGAKLARLNVDGNPIRDLAPLQGMPLEELWLNGAQVKDLSPLKGMSLRLLEVDGTYSDLSVLREMPLKRLKVRSPNVTDFSPIGSCPLESIWGSFVPSRDAALLRSIKTLQTVNGKPAAEFLKDFGSSPTATPAAAAPPVFPNDPERTAAAWALSRGGTVTVRLKSVNRILTRLDELPAEGPLAVLRITVSHSKVVTDAELQVLASLKAITWLDLIGDANVTDAGLEHLAELTTLQHLGLKGASLHGPGLRHLAGLSKLQYLALADAPLEDASFQTLGPFPELTVLDVSGTRIGAGGLERFASGSKVSSLGLGNCRGIGVAEMRAVSMMPLSGLLMDSAETTDEALRELMAPELSMLLLGGAKITDAGLRNFSRFPKLAELNLSRTGVGDEGMHELEGLLKLRYLGITGTKVTDRGLSTIARIKGLEHLNLGSLKLTATGLAELKALPLRIANLGGVTLDRNAARAIGSWSELENLVLSTTSLTDDGLAELAKLSKLRTLDVSNTKATGAGVAKLKADMPNCQVTWDDTK